MAGLAFIDEAAWRPRYLRPFSRDEREKGIVDVFMIPNLFLGFNRRVESKYAVKLTRKDKWSDMGVAAAELHLIWSASALPQG